MKFFITGGTGYVGTALIKTLTDRQHEVTATGRSGSHPLEGNRFFRYISADTTQEGNWQEEVKNADVIVNLAGVNIFRPWTEENKKAIYDSRILTTRHIADALSSDREVIFLSTSAAGFYGDRKDQALDETASPGNDFLAKVCVDWENAAKKASEKKARVVLMRFGVVLGKNGGALSKMALPFKLFMGGPLGNGMQYFPWIHMEDLISAILFMVETKAIDGPVNLTAPGTVRQKQFAKKLGEALNRPAVMPAPKFFVKLFMGELGEAFLSSQQAVPQKLMDNGFHFAFPELQQAFNKIFKKGS